jgi:hypothetical protein
MQIGFLLNRFPLYFMPTNLATKKVFTPHGTDIFKNPWWHKFVPGTARFVVGYQCVPCQNLLVVYKRSYNQKELIQHLETELT